MIGASAAMQRAFPAVVLLLQFALCSYTFPLTELFSSKPLFHIDGAFHWYMLKGAVDLAKTGNVTGYDPFFAAGTAEGDTQNDSAKVPALLAVTLSPWFNEKVVWKLFSFGASIAAPVAVLFALRITRAPPLIQVIGTSLGLLLWWVSVFRWYHTAGMVSFVLAAYLSLPYATYLIRWLLQGNAPKAPLVLGLTGAAGTFLHPLFGVGPAIGMAAAIGTSWRTLPWRRLLCATTIVPALSLLPNLFWLYPRIFSPSYVRPDLVSYQAIVDPNILWMELIGLWHGHAQGSKMYALILLGAVTACITRYRSVEYRYVLASIIAGLLLELLAVEGGRSHAIALLIQPNRFAPVGYLFLVPTCAYGLADASRLALHGIGQYRSWAARLVLAAAVLIGVINVNELRREVSYADIGHYGARPPETRSLGPYSHYVLQWLSRDTTPEGRVLFETSEGRIYDDAHMAGYYAYTSHRQFIGGPYPFFHFAGFRDGNLFEQPIQRYGRDRFVQYLDLYNIGWIIAHSAPAKRFLDTVPELRRTGGFRELATYEVRRPLNFFIKGQGHVDGFQSNAVELAGLSGHAVIIKFHYIKGLKADPPTTIKKEKFMNDPTPFVKLVDPPTKLRLYVP